MDTNVVHTPHALQSSRRAWKAAYASALALMLFFPFAWAKQDFAALDTFIEQEMARERVPGLALAIIRDGQVVHMRGYGHRDVERGLPVTPQTVFAIGSITKSFTVLTLGSLAQEGRLDWDAPVRRYLPDFALHDRYAAEHMTPRDLVTHRSGLPRHDMVWRNLLARKDYYQRLRHLRPTAELRTRYQYNNLMYVTAGYLAEQVAGQPWERLAEQRLFAPLDMRNSYTWIDAYDRASEPARPYSLDAQRKPVRVPYADIDAIAPAGSINSTVEDMSHYLQALMDGGRWQGRQVLDADTVQQMHTPQTIIPGTPPYPELAPAQYGMGLQVTSYRGARQFGHGGAIDGFNAYMAWLPDHGVGVVMLVNLSNNDLRNTVPYRVFDQMLGLDPIDWAARYEAAKASDRAARNPAASAAPQARHADTRPSHALADYAGQYTHPAYGTARVSLASGNLQLEFNGARIPLTHYHYDVFETPADPLSRLQRQKLRFGTRLDGDVDSLEIRLEPATEAIVFLRDGGTAMREARFLEHFTGEYAVGSRTARVALREGTLWFSFDDQPWRELRPLRGTRFALNTDDGVEFLGDAGRYDRLVFRGSTGDQAGTRRASTGR